MARSPLWLIVSRRWRGERPSGSKVRFQSSNGFPLHTSLPSLPLFSHPTLRGSRKLFLSSRARLPSSPPPFPSFLLLPDNTFVRYKCSFISERGEKMWVENTFVRTMDGEFFLSLFPSLLFFESIRLLFKSNVQRRTVVRVGNNIAPSLYNLLTL